MAYNHVPTVAEIIDGASRRRRFAVAMRDIRKRHVGKQIVLALMAECSAVLVSLWETGRRRPSEAKFLRLVGELEKSGVPANEIEVLRDAWAKAA